MSFHLQFQYYRDLPQAHQLLFLHWQNAFRIFVPIGYTHRKVFSHTDILRVLTWLYIQPKYNFNRSVDNLPDNITYLTFERCFNQPIDNLPASLESLKLGNRFYKSINNLPNNLRFLNIENPNYYLSSQLPSSIRTLNNDEISIATRSLTRSQ